LKIDPCKKWKCLISKTTYTIIKFSIYNLIIGKIGDVTNGDKKKNTSKVQKWRKDKANK
jgi:hypothetical protein